MLESGDNPEMRRLSRLLSLVLRHHPEIVGVALDSQGWADVDALILGLNQLPANATNHQRTLQIISRASLEAVVACNDKQRFTFSGDGHRIRAVQGHSIEIDLGYPASRPPPVLYHGTHVGALAAIQAEGLTAQSRNDVHLSRDLATARKVGGRRGRPVVLVVDAARMHADGYVFREADNGTWLTACVPSAYLQFP
jgi:putative RNA 2'-phosphotransferase